MIKNETGRKNKGLFRCFEVKNKTVRIEVKFNECEKNCCEIKFIIDFKSFYTVEAYERERLKYFYHE